MNTNMTMHPFTTMPIQSDEAALEQSIPEATPLMQEHGVTGEMVQQLQGGDAYQQAAAAAVLDPEQAKSALVLYHQMAPLLMQLPEPVAQQYYQEVAKPQIQSQFPGQVIPEQISHADLSMPDSLEEGNSQYMPVSGRAKAQFQQKYGTLEQLNQRMSQLADAWDPTFFSKKDQLADSRQDMYKKYGGFLPDVVLNHLMDAKQEDQSRKFQIMTDQINQINAAWNEIQGTKESPLLDVKDLEEGDALTSLVNAQKNITLQQSTLRRIIERGTPIGSDENTVFQSVQREEEAELNKYMKTFKEKYPDSTELDALQMLPTYQTNKANQIKLNRAQQQAAIQAQVKQVADPTTMPGSTDPGDANFNLQKLKATYGL